MTNRPATALRLALIATLGLLTAPSVGAAQIPPAAPDGSPAARRRLEARVAAIVAAAGVRADTPGCAVLVQRCGRPVLARGYGLADLSRRAPITTETRFELASVSKQFTALAVMRLVADGKVSLDEPIGRYVTELGSHPGRHATIRQLLHHTSGIPDYLEMMDDLGIEDDASLDNAAVVRLLRSDGRVRSAPGARYEYSNSNYVLLAEVVARAGGSSYGRFLRERIFQPLGMPDATVMDVAGVAIPGRAVPYARAGRRFTVDDYAGPVVGDGGVVVSLRDFVRWQAAWSTEAVVPRALIECAWTSGRTSDGEATGYGFGWSVEGRGSRLEVSHDGSYVGFRTYVAMAPARGTMVVVLANRDDIDPEAVGSQIASAWDRTVGAEVAPRCER
ncbi:MAG: serine hydrolase domain-containing protein [Polyangiales bacterium]